MAIKWNILPLYVLSSKNESLLGSYGFPLNLNMLNWIDEFISGFKILIQYSILGYFYGS